ncbi:MAG: DUF2442 domain-containing protein [Nitrospira sp.]|nr:DUF2442 domain-containing protein [Nitrospira sp.]
MQPTQVSQSNRAAAVEPAIQPTAPWRVASVHAEPERQLRVTFVDGTTGTVDLRNFLNAPQIQGTVFEPLRDPAVFAQMRVAMGVVQWPNGADLAPDAMYDAIKLHGCWIVE